MRSLLYGFACWLITIYSLAQTPSLVKDINPGSANSIPHYSSNRYYTNANGIYYFVANETTTGIELWRSDGTGNGTYLVKDIYPGAGHSYPENLTYVNGVVYFTANDGVHGIELWRSDGTQSGTYLVKDINPGSVDGFLLNPYFTNVAGTLYFQAIHPIYGSGIWRSDGSESGTTFIEYGLAGSGQSGLHDMVEMNGSLYFVAADSYQGITGPELWRIDSPTGNPILVKDIYPGSAGSNPINLTRVGGVLYFLATNYSVNYELWRSDGTEAGTYLVKELTPGTDGSSGKVSDLTDINGILFFVFNDFGALGQEVWRSNGTEGGTYLVKDINPGAVGSSPSNLTNYNGIAYFAAVDGVHGNELWRSDGTENGTYLVKDINPDSYGSDPQDLVTANNILYYTANDGTTGRELWQSDGTLNGTHLVYDISPGGADPFHKTNVNGTLFFVADDGVHGQELWILPKPESDLTPIVYARPFNAYGTTDLTVIVDVLELNSVATTGSFTVRITKDPKVNLTFPASATSINGRPVQNGVWSFGTETSYYVLTTSQRVEPGNKLSFGLAGTLSPGATTGQLNISAILLPMSLVEARLTNNADADKIEYFQQ